MDEPVHSEGSGEVAISEDGSSDVSSDLVTLCFFGGEAEIHCDVAS